MRLHSDMLCQGKVLQHVSEQKRAEKQPVFTQLTASLKDSLDPRLALKQKTLLNPTKPY